MSLINVKTMEITAKIPDGFNLAQETAYYEKHIHNSKTAYYPFTFSGSENDTFVIITDTNGC